MSCPYRVGDSVEVFAFDWYPTTVSTVTEYAGGWILRCNNGMCVDWITASDIRLVSPVGAKETA